MIEVSDKCKNDCNNAKIAYREFIVIDGVQVDIKGQLDATAYKDTTFFGTFNMKMLTFEAENDINYKGKEFIYYKEVNGEAFKIGKFITTEVKDSDTFENVTVTAYDYGLKFANPYTTSLDYSSGEITMYQVAQEICQRVGIALANETLPNGDFIVDSNQFVNDEQYGDVVCLIAIENGTFATINNDDKLEFIFKKETDEIIEDYTELDDKRDTQPISCVLVATTKDLATAGAVRKDEELVAQYGENWLKIYDYGFAYSSEKCDQLVDAIFEQVKGFGYSAFTSKYSFKPYMTLGDTLNLRNKNGELIYSILTRYNTNYDDITLESPSIISASVEYDLPETADDVARKASIKVDQQNATIESVVNQTTEQNEKINRVTQTVDELNSKISDIADITTSQETNKATLSFEKVNQSEPIRIEIRPLSENISYLYPNSNLYPNENLYLKVRTLKFTNTSNNTYVDYELPTDLLYYDNDNYDEFILDYDAQSCIVNKRVGYNTDGTTYILENPSTIEYEYPRILLEDGDYTITLLGYNIAYLFVRLMSQNIYTTQFATKAELNSEISQTTSEINLSVDKKLSDYSTTTEMNSAISISANQINSVVSKKVGNDEIISKINQSSEAVTINANKISLKRKRN